MDSIPSQLLLQIILILLNAFFAATEIAVLSLNKTQLEKKAENGEKTAKRLLILLQEPSGFLSTIQIGITLAGFLGSAFAAMIHWKGGKICLLQRKKSSVSCYFFWL